MPKAVTASGMKKIDTLAQTRYGIPAIILMENAGIRSAEEIYKDLKHGRVCIFSGKGNNGGDGFVCARHLKSYGLKADIFLIGRANTIKNEAPLINLRIAKKMGVPIKEFVSKDDINTLQKKFHYDIIVDAIFGIGFRGILPE
ncbi:MAG: NAD(P)H-hydrate epimerase, partial [Candidatus Omnitrophota bacterium]